MITNSFYRTSVASAVLVLSAPLAMASTILVDDFTTPAALIVTQDGNPAEIDVPGGSILGNTRTMWASTDDTGTGGQASTTFEVQVGGNEIKFGNGSGVTGQAVLIYDGGGAGTPFSFTFNDLAVGVSGDIDVDFNGLGGVDFLDGNLVTQRAFEFSGSSFDTAFFNPVTNTIDPASATFRAYAWDVDGTLAEYDEIIGGPDFTELLGLTEFTTTGGGDGIFDWTGVGALAFSIESNTPQFDGSLGAISVVPLPASTLLLLGGLSSLVGASVVGKRRRRRKST